MDSNHKKSSVPRDVSFDNLKDILHEDSNEQHRVSTNGQTRPSIKSLFTKKFPPLKSSTSINITSKPKKSRTSFRHFSQLLKRSHSAHSDLSSANEIPTEPNNPTLRIPNSNEFNSNHPSRPLSTTNSSGLGPITEEENPPMNKSKTLADEFEQTNVGTNLSEYEIHPCEFVFFMHDDSDICV